MEKQAKTTAVAKENIAAAVLTRIDALQKDGTLVLPQSYAVANHINSAWLALQATKDRQGNNALAVCTQPSIANALFDMVLQGLSVAKKQGYFIVYGSELQFQRSYFGTVALAKRSGKLACDPVANVIYEGDDFVYNIDPKTGRLVVIKHSQSIENIDVEKIKGAYCIVTYADGSTNAVVMSWAQIQKSWGQGATKGASPAHKNFADEMAKKTVIGRACKMIINSGSDAWLYEGKRDEADAPDRAEAERAAVTDAPKADVDVDFTDYEDISSPVGEPDPADAKPEEPNY